MTEHRARARPRATAGRTGGFTLIEVLIALAIIAIGLGALVAESVQYTRNALRMQDVTLAHWVAVDRVTEQQLARAWPSAGRSNGRHELAGRDWHWAMTVTETPDENIRRIDIEVRSDPDSGRADATVVGFLQRPGP